MVTAGGGVVGDRADPAAEFAGSKIIGPQGPIRGPLTFNQTAVFCTPTLTILRDTVNIEYERAEGPGNFAIFGFARMQFYGHFC